MARFTNGFKLAAHQAERAKRVSRSLRAATRELADKGKEDALELTSGTVSKETLKRLGHPFARKPVIGRRRGGQRGSLPRLPINAQSGYLQRHFRVWQASKDSWVLANNAPYGKFILAIRDTKYMVARGFYPALRVRYERRRARLITAKRKAERF